MSSMSSAATAGLNLATPSARGGLTILERNWLRTIFYIVVLVFVFWCGYKFERDYLHRHPGEHRFIREATEAAMRYVTIPHFIIGILFMVTSPKNQNARQRAWLVGLLIVGTGLCAAYFQGSARANIILVFAVYLYFMVHELRDQAMFYTALSPAPPFKDRAAFSAFVRVITGLLVLITAAAALIPAPFGVYTKKMTGNAFFSASSLYDGSLPLTWKILLAGTVLALAVAAPCYALPRLARRLGFADVKGMTETHAPLLRVMIGAPIVLFLSFLLTRRPYGLILLHVVGWYVFAAYQLAHRPPKAPPRDWWLWMRTTAAGFKTLHIGLWIFIMGLAIIWTLGGNQSPWFWWLLSPEAFMYWTIMHVTVSFVPR